MVRYDTVWTNARLATMRTGGAAYGAIADGLLAARDGRIAWVGTRSAFDGDPVALAREVIDVGGRWITPGLIDPHTHVIFGGDRIADFERRVAGESYIAAAEGGSGIAYTVAMTRAATEEELFRSAERRLRTMIGHGTTTVEIKSGYGLDVETELRMLRVGRRLGSATGISVRATYLGAHVVPSEYAERREAYLALVCDTVIPQLVRERLADAVDVFCDALAFTPRETERVFHAARIHGLPVKAHADQLTAIGATRLAATHRALSADHLECASDDDVAALAAAGTVAVLLPGAYHYLRETRKPPIEALRRYHVPIALATDCNPGTSPVLALPVAMNLACVLFGLTPEEALAGVTIHAARALGYSDRGVLEAGQRCDLALWDVTSPVELSYWLGVNPCVGLVVTGNVLRASAIAR